LQKPSGQRRLEAIDPQDAQARLSSQENFVRTPHGFSRFFMPF
jgi:hypothetical protein